jgi:hypothetical protein
MEQTLTKKQMNSNTKANLLAIGIMAVIIGIGIYYGYLLEKSFYLPQTY